MLFATRLCLPACAAACRPTHPRRSARIWRHMAATLLPSSTTMQRCCRPEGMRMRAPTRTVTGSRTQPCGRQDGGGRARACLARAAARGRRAAAKRCPRSKLAALRTHLSHDMLH